MLWKYGTEDLAASRNAATRIGEILALLADQLERQRASHRLFLVGDDLSALDLYWACFSNMVSPLPPEHSAMLDWIRQLYGEAAGVAPPHTSLIEHRDFVFAEYLALPQDF